MSHVTSGSPASQPEKPPEAFVSTSLLLLDMHMPGLTGLDVIRQLRFMQVGDGKRTAAIILSADATVQASEASAEAGAEGGRRIEQFIVERQREGGGNDARGHAARVSEHPARYPE